MLNTSHETWAVTYICVCVCVMGRGCVWYVYIISFLLIGVLFQSQIHIFVVSLAVKSFKYRSNCRDVFCNWSVLKYFAKSQQNTCERVSFLIKLRAWDCNFIKKATLVQVFSCKFSKIFKHTFFIEHLRWLLL